MHIVVMKLNNFESRSTFIPKPKWKYKGKLKIDWALGAYTLSISYN